MTGLNAKRIVAGIRTGAGARNTGVHASVRTALVVLSSILVVASCGDGDPTAPSSDPVSIETETLADAIEGQGYSQQLTAAGGSGGYSWVLAAGSLPSGVTLSPTGTISGTPGGAGTSGFRVRATDAGGQNDTQDLSILVVQALAVHTWTLPDAQAGEGYAAQLQAAGGRGTLAWSLTGEAASWLTVSPAGALAGTPAVSGASTVTVAVTDESGQQATRQLPIIVRAPLAVAAISLPTGTEGRAYAAQLVATGGDGVYGWVIESGALPTGVTLTAGGAITGTPAGGGEFTFTAQVTDGAHRVATRSLSLTVDRAPTIQTGILPPGDVGEPYTAQLVASGGTGAYTWSLAEGALPAGLTLAPDGAISGTPAEWGGTTFTLRVTDETGTSHARAFTLVVARIEALANGVALSSIVDEAGSARYYAIEVPTGATQLTVVISGGTGDADLYVRRGELPREYAYDCRPFRPGNDETCTFTSPAAGYWYIMLRGHEDYGNVSLVATHDR